MTQNTIRVKVRLSDAWYGEAAIKNMEPEGSGTRITFECVPPMFNAVVPGHAPEEVQQALLTSNRTHESYGIYYFDENIANLFDPQI